MCPYVKTKEYMKQTTHQFKTWSEEEHETWKRLATRQLPLLKTVVSQMWLNGQETLDWDLSQIPNLETTAATVKNNSNWQLVHTDQTFADGQTWFETLKRNEFMITKYIRPLDSLDYTPMPDVFHDLFGHVPFLLDEQLSQIIQHFTARILSASPDERVKLGHIWWYTIEFGLIKEQGQLRILGAGIASSFAETQKVVNREIEIIPFDPELIGHTVESHHEMHDRLFVLESLDQLEEVLERLSSCHPGT